jgi:hypothetical protein
MTRSSINAPAKPGFHADPTPHWESTDEDQVSTGATRPDLMS